MVLRVLLKGWCSKPSSRSVSLLTGSSGIFPGASFVYDFEASEAGSYWIHSHAPGQYPKGIRVPFIVQDSTDLTTYNYEKKYDQVIAVSDWYECSVFDA